MSGAGQPGLDGMRALAVVAVMLYHANHTWLGGGFLGVEVFFVISGYLITLLLIGEYQRKGRIELGQFWKRRARRLLPALIVMLAGLVFLTIHEPCEISFKCSSFGCSCSHDYSPCHREVEISLVVLLLWIPGCLRDHFDDIFPSSQGL